MSKTYRLVLGGVLGLCAATLPAGAGTWVNGNGTWDNANTASWTTPAAVPVALDVISLTQSSASNIAIGYAATTMTGTELAAGTRYGNLTLSNAGGGTTTLSIDGTDLLPVGTNFTVGSGGKLDISGGTVTPDQNVAVQAGGQITQSGGLIQPRLYDLNMSGGTYTVSNGSSKYRVMNINPSSGTATFTQSGGTVTTTVGSTGLNLTPTATGSAAYNLSAGSLLISNYATMTMGANATFTLSGTGAIGSGVVTETPGNFTQTGGTYTQTGGNLKLVWDWTIGGQANVSGGTVNIRQLIVNNSGAFTMGPAATLTLTGNQYLYVQNSGTFTNNGGTMPALATLFISGGSYNTNTSTYNVAAVKQTGGTINLNSGTVTCSYETEVGKDAGQTAVYNYAGGSLVRSRGLDLGSNGGTGTFNHAGNLTTRWVDNNGTTGWLRIGGTTGQGVYFLGDATGPGTITSIGQNGPTEGWWIGQTGTFRGRGAVQNMYWGGFRNSGKVIADGFGTNNDLDLSNLGSHYAGFDTLVNPVDNPSGGTAGWYAVNKGKLKFPTQGIGSDTTTVVRASNGSVYNIGESKYSVDPTLDLVNSAQIAFTGLSDGASGSLTAALLAPDRTDIPLGQFQSAEFLGHVVDVFQFAGSNFTFTSAALTVRYDEAFALNTLGIPENYLHLYQYSATTSTWDLVTAGYSVPSTHLLISKPITFAASGYFAVGVLPEPTGLALLGLGSLFLARRRTR